MGIIATDILVKTMLEAAFADLRKNDWIVTDIFSDMVFDPLSKMDFGWKEVERAKEWFKGNDIPVYLTNRIDTPRFPCVTVVRVSSREMTERAEVSDGYDESQVDPHNITTAVQQMYGPFTPSSYNPATGTVTLPSGLDTSNAFVGQFLVSSKTGRAYIINNVVPTNAVTVAPGTVDDFTNAYISPPTVIWNLVRERIWLEETFAIGMHTISDVNEAIWLRQLVQYVVLRYKEAWLERRNFALSTFNTGSIDENPHFKGTERVYSCMMSLSGQVDATFVKYAAPKLQGFKVGVYILDGPKTPVEYEKYAQAQGWSMEGDLTAIKKKRRKRLDPLSKDET